jgi:hypothetical protein
MEEEGEEERQRKRANMM